MNRKRLKSITSLVLIISIFISMFASCSAPQSTDSTNETSTSETEVKETVAENIENQSSSYRGTQRTLTTALDGIKKYSIQDEKILGVGEVIDTENRVISYYLTSWEENWREEWKEKGKIELPFTTSNYTLQCNGLDMDSEGNTYIILTDSSENHIYLVKVDGNGKIVQNDDIIGKLPTDITISEMTIGNNDIIYLVDKQERAIYRINEEGNLLDEYKVEEGYLWDLPKNNDNTIYLVTEKRNQLYLSVPIEGEEFLFESSGHGIPVNHYMDVYEGMDNDFFITTTSGLLSYHVGDDAAHQVVDWTLSGIDAVNVNYVGVMAGEEEQVVTIISENSATTDIYTFVKSDGTEDNFLILATLGGVGSDLEKQIIDYNKLHPDFPIQTKTYIDNEDGLRQLNTDLLTGTIIDMIDANSLQHLTSLDYYAEQGLLEDIGAWLQKDETIDETDLVQSVLDANKVDGILYNLVPSFTIETFVGPQLIVGDDFAWTVEEALEAMKQSPEQAMYTFQTKETFISDFCRHNGFYLVNEDEGICHFESEDFIELLTYANTLPDEIEDPNKISANREVYFQNSLLFQLSEFEVELGRYRGTKGRFSQGVAQDAASFVGFPTLDKTDTSGSIFVNRISIAMTSTSPKKEQAWGFFQYLLSDKYQNDEREVIWGKPYIRQVGFPIRQSIIQRIFQEQLSIDQQKMEGEKTGEYIKGHFGGRDWRVYDEFIIQKDIDFVNDFLNAINRVAWENDKIYNIIWEEAQYYFSGECTAEEAAQRMQSRVELYLMEKE